MCRVLFLLPLLWIAGTQDPASAVEPSTVAGQPAVQSGEVNASEEACFAAFEEALHEVVLVGHFTIIGSENQAAEERYEIRSVSKLPEGNYWLFRCRIQYGDHDLTVPLPLEVNWAGDTPVITLDEVSIPGMGEFSARVVIDGDCYAGIWRHGEAGGHLFGVIEPFEVDDGEQ